MGWRLLVGWLAVGGLSLWLLLALGAWLFVKYRRDFPGVEYADLAWPGRWPQYRVSQGNHYIGQGAELLRQGDYAQAAHKLRAGVSKSPANAAGRNLLARVYLAYRRPDLAKDTLIAGLPHLGGDPVYLQTTLGFLLEFQDDSTLVEVTGRLLAAPTGPLIRPILATFAATGAFNRGNYDESEDLLNRHRLTETPDGAILMARLAWERGLPELALLRLREHISRSPGHDAARAQLVEYYLSLGRISEWESTLVERVAAAPLAAAPRVAYLQLHQRRGDRPRVERETTAFLRQFGDDPAALLLLADFAAHTGQPDLARQVRASLASHPEQAGAAALTVAEAHLVAGQYQPALDLIAGYAREFPGWAGQFAPACNGLQAVALAGLGRMDEARLSLEQLLAQKSIRAENLVAVANHLALVGARPLALATLSRAVETDPLNQAALANLIRLELETGSLAGLPAHLGRFVHMRQPSREILAQAYAVLGSDRHLLMPAQPELLVALQSALRPPL